MRSLVERLGFEVGDRVAIVHADDIGMCHAANVGAFEALAGGPVTCGSIMVPCPWFSEAAERARAHPELDLGVHLTLTAEWARYRWGPVSSASAVPSLLDEQGVFPRTVADVLLRAKSDEVETELRAQIERALESGIDVTHLDAHMGVAFLPPFVEIYARLCRDYQLPAFLVCLSEKVLELLGASDSAHVYDRVLDELAADGIPILDGFDDDSLHFEPGRGEAHNRARLENLPAGVSYLICHPAQAGDELSAISADAHMRDFERTFYGGEAGHRMLAELGIRTIGMRRLRDLVRTVG